MLAREYVPGDEQEIAELFNIVFGRKLDLNYWNWRFTENPYGKGIIRLMFDNQRLVGHYALTPTPLWVRGVVYKAAFSMTTMTHPDYRGRGIFTGLASEVYNHCKESGIKIVFGFPNENSYHGFTEKLDWIGFGPIRGWATEMGLGNLPDKDELVCEELKICDKRVDDLWTRVGEPKRVMVPRTSEFFNWRYFQKPDGEYTIYCVKDHNDVLQGMVVLKVFANKCETTGHIIDFLAPDRPEIHHTILKRANEFFTENKVTIATCWIPRYSPITSLLRAEGFYQKEWTTYSGVRILDNAFADTSFVTDSNHWWFTMGDSDVF